MLKDDENISSADDVFDLVYGFISESIPNCTEENIRELCKELYILTNGFVRRTCLL